MSAATESALGLLHEAVAQLLTARIQSGEATAADVANALKMLKDNNITAIADRGTALDSLRERLASAPALQVEGKDLADALESIEWRNH